MRIAGVRYLGFVVLVGAVAGGSSLLIAGWAPHVRFLERLGTGWISPWMFNSSLTVIFDNLRGIAGWNEPWYGAASMLIRCGAALAAVIAVFQSRRRVPVDAARRHLQ